MVFDRVSQLKRKPKLYILDLELFQLPSLFLLTNVFLKSRNKQKKSSRQQSRAFINIIIIIEGIYIALSVTKVLYNSTIHRNFIEGHE